MSSEAISTLRLSRWVRRRASLAVVVVLPEPCRPTIMIATGGTALRSMVWPSEPKVAISSSWTILTTIWPGVTDLTTVAPTACSRTFSMRLRTTSSETSASNSARRTSRIAASTSASDSDPRPVSRSRMPPSRSDRLSNNAVILCPACAGAASMCPGATRQDDRPNTFAPEGASRCRALASGLQGRAAGRKERLSDERRDLQCRRAISQGLRWIRRAADSGSGCRCIVLLLRQQYLFHVGFRPDSQIIDGGGKGLAERRDRIFNGDRHGWDRPAADETVALQALEGLRQHFLRDAFDLPPQLVKADGAVAQQAEHQNGPFVGNPVQHHPGRAGVGIGVPVLEHGLHGVSGG